MDKLCISCAFLLRDNVLHLFRHVKQKIDLGTRERFNLEESALLGWILTGKRYKGASVTGHSVQSGSFATAANPHGKRQHTGAAAGLFRTVPASQRQ